MAWRTKLLCKSKALRLKAFDESKHPRDHGMFSSGGGASGGSSKPRELKEHAHVLSNVREGLKNARTREEAAAAINPSMARRGAKQATKEHVTQQLAKVKDSLADAGIDPKAARAVARVLKRYQRVED
jgi:hypothetical protein